MVGAKNLAAMLVATKHLNVARTTSSLVASSLCYGALRSYILKSIVPPARVSFIMSFAVVSVIKDLAAWLFHAASPDFDSSPKVHTSSSCSALRLD